MNSLNHVNLNFVSGVFQNFDVYFWLLLKVERVLSPRRFWRENFFSSKFYFLLSIWIYRLLASRISENISHSYTFSNSILWCWWLHHRFCKCYFNIDFIVASPPMYIYNRNSRVGNQIAIAKWSLLILFLKFLLEFCRLFHCFFSVLLPI